MMGDTGILLLSSAAGYWVLERSSGHKGQLKSVGQVVGWVVIVASLVGVACRVSRVATGSLGYCPFGKTAAMAPMAGQATSPSRPAK